MVFLFSGCMFLFVMMNSSFSQTHKVGDVGIIANFVFPYICSFLFHLHQLILLNVKLEIKGYVRIIFQNFIVLSDFKWQS